MTEENRNQHRPIGSDLVRGDPSFAAIVAQFVDGLTRRIEEMETAIQARNFSALREAAHQLKGSGGGYGYPVLTEQAAELERQAATQALDACTRAFDELKQLCEQLVVDVGDDGAEGPR